MPWHQNLNLANKQKYIHELAIVANRIRTRHTNCTHAKTTWIDVITTKCTRVSVCLSVCVCVTSNRIASLQQTKISPHNRCMTHNTYTHHMRSCDSFKCNVICTHTLDLHTHIHTNKRIVEQTKRFEAFGTENRVLVRSLE